MGTADFEAFVRDVRVLNGLQHHLGAVGNEADVEGLRLLLRATRSAEFQITAVVQTDADQNMVLTRQLQEAGIRVITVREIDPNNPVGVTVRSTGEVEARGANVYDPSPIMQETRSRIENLTRAAEMLETHPNLVPTRGASPAQIATVCGPRSTRIWPARSWRTSSARRPPRARSSAPRGGPSFGCAGRPSSSGRRPAAPDDSSARGREASPSGCLRFRSGSWPSRS